MLDVPSGPEAVLTLWLESNLSTSSWEQVTLDRTGLCGGGEKILGSGPGLVKHEVKKLLKRLAFSIGVFAVTPR